MDSIRCCICGKRFEGHGNNSWPIDENKRHRCCNDCNLTFVIPQRIKAVLKGKKYENK